MWLLIALVPRQYSYVISTGTNYEYVHSTEKLYSSGTIPIYPLSIYARDNPPSAQPMLGVSIEERPLRGPPPHIE